MTIKTEFTCYTLGPYLQVEEGKWYKCDLNDDGKTCVVHKDGGRLDHNLQPWDKIRYTIGWQNSLEPPRRGYSPQSALPLGVIEATFSEVEEREKMWTHPVHKWSQFKFFPANGLGRLVNNQGWEYGQHSANKCFEKLNELLTKALGVRA